MHKFQIKNIIRHPVFNGANSQLSLKYQLRSLSVFESDRRYLINLHKTFIFCMIKSSQRLNILTFEENYTGICCNKSVQFS
ncbi:MAG: hypothetical protein JWP37_2888 [Mucilaginibacter sp.]|nr:hypothetical protein [Mucilaginibacter sp.]